MGLKYHLAIPDYHQDYLDCCKLTMLDHALFNM